MATQASSKKKESFRDHLSTVGDDGRRKWVYPKKPVGKYYNLRTLVSYLLLLILFGSPFIRIGGNPLILMDVIHRKFVLFGVVFWPQDFIIFGMIFLTIVIMIVLFTVAFGRVFCGWICPQTIFMEMVFRKIEYWIEGDYTKQKKLDKQPWNQEKILKKGFKHIIFLTISFIIANTFLAYIIGTEELYMIVTDNPANHAVGLMAITVFSLAFYGVFAKFREQVCTIACPYGRLQGVLLDNDSVVVAYDYQRGEPRGKLRKGKERTNFGDCIDCKQCVFVCPTGIDIRDGTQLECINCTACMDACDSIMDRIGKPKGLVRYDSINGIEKHQKFKITPRIMAYTVVLLALMGVIVGLLMTRDELDITLMRARGQIYQKTSIGTFTNLYNYKVINKTSDDKTIQFKLITPLQDAGANINIKMIGQENAYNKLSLSAGELQSGTMIIEMPKAVAKKHDREIQLGIYNQDGHLIQTLHNKFMIP